MKQIIEEKKVHKFFLEGRKNEIRSVVRKINIGQVIAIIWEAGST